MSNMSHSLMIKFGLPKEPSDTEVQSWVQKTKAYMSEGKDAEEAGMKAAHEVFPDCGRMKYASQADTIMALLEQAKNK